MRLCSAPHCVLPTLPSPPSCHSLPSRVSLRVSCHMSCPLDSKGEEPSGAFCQTREWDWTLPCLFRARPFRGASRGPEPGPGLDVRVVPRENSHSHIHSGSDLHVSPALFGERTADSCSTHPVLKASSRTLGTAMPFGQRPRPQSHPFSTLGRDTRGVSCGKRLGGSGVCSIRVPMYIRCPHTCQPRPWPTQGAGDTATHGLARRPVAEGSERPLNLPNTKKLKYFNILFFFLVPEFILWVLGSHCVIHIHIYI